MLQLLINILIFIVPVDNIKLTCAVYIFVILSNVFAVY